MVGVDRDEVVAAGHDREAAGGVAQDVEQRDVPEVLDPREPGLEANVGVGAR